MNGARCYTVEIPSNKALRIAKNIALWVALLGDLYMLADILFPGAIATLADWLPGMSGFFDRYSFLFRVPANLAAIFLTALYHLVNVHDLAKMVSCLRTLFLHRSLRKGRGKVHSYVHILGTDTHGARLDYGTFLLSPVPQKTEIGHLFSIGYDLANRQYFVEGPVPNYLSSHQVTEISGSAMSYHLYLCSIADKF